jgi:hypothetical protein
MELMLRSQNSSRGWCCWQTKKAMRGIAGSVAKASEKSKRACSPEGRTTSRPKSNGA